MTVITRIILICRAYKDAKYIMENKGQFNAIPAWMQKNIDDYKITLERNTTKRSCGVLRTYSKIKQVHSLLKEENDKETAFQDFYTQEIAKREKKIEGYEKMLSEAHKGAPVPPGLTMERIHSNIKVLRNQIETLKGDRDKGRSERIGLGKKLGLGKKRPIHKELVEKYTKKVRRLKSKFNDKVNAVHAKNEKIRIAYDNQFSLYWGRICMFIEAEVKKPKKKRIISELIQIKQFPMNIQEVVGPDMCSADRLFENERRFINETVNKDFNIYHEV